MPPPLPRGGFGIPWGLSSSPEAPLQGELAAKQTERLYEVRPDLLRQRRGKFFRLSGFFANKNRAAGNVRTCGAVYRLEEIVLVENGFLSQFSKIVPIKMAYLRYAVCGCCLCIKNANCYKSRRDYKDSILHLAQKINLGSKNQGNLLFCTKQNTLKSLDSKVFQTGAAIQIRTGDLILTKDALYQLSYSSKWRPGSGSNRRPPA